MKVKLSFLFAFFSLILNLNAQVEYTREALEKRYNQETILLEQNVWEKNGVRHSYFPNIPSQSLREEIEVNGDKAAKDQYRQYLKNTGRFWLAYGIGLISLIAVFATISSGTLSVSTLLLIALLSGAATAASLSFSMKAIRNLHRSVWLFNRHVLLGKN